MRSGWRCRVPGTGRTAEGCRSFRRLRFLSGKLCNQSIALEVLRLEPLASNSGHAFGRKIRECGHRGHRITRFSCAISLKFKFKFKLFFRIGRYWKWTGSASGVGSTRGAWSRWRVRYTVTCRNFVPCWSRPTWPTCVNRRTRSTTKRSVRLASRGSLAPPLLINHKKSEREREIFFFF